MRASLLFFLFFNYCLLACTPSPFVPPPQDFPVHTSAAQLNPPMKTATTIESTLAVKTTEAETLSAVPVSHPTSSHWDITRQRLAKRAWRYFLQFTSPDTGLASGTMTYPYVTMWDVGSNIAAIISAEALGLLPKKEAKQRLQHILHTLSHFPLYNQELPSREYHALTADPNVTVHNHFKNGNGWSAIDMGRLLIWLKITAQRYPTLTKTISSIQHRWQLQRLIHQGELYGAYFDRSGERYRQEGRFGYQQYAAAGLLTWGLEAKQAFSWDHIQSTEIEGTRIHFDTRNLPFLTSEPFFLAQIELGGVSPTFKSIIQQVYQAHAHHYTRTQQITALTEDSTDQPPWFLYNNLFYQGNTWQGTSHTGRFPTLTQTLSLKAALAWAVLFEDEYTPVLWQAIEQMLDTRTRQGLLPTGRYADGSYNLAYNINTHAVVLTCLAFYQRGKTPWLEGPLPSLNMGLL